MSDSYVSPKNLQSLITTSFIEIKKNYIGGVYTAYL